MYSKVLVHMRGQNFGRVICVSSVVAHKPSFGTSGYAASKSALEGYIRGLHLILLPKVLQQIRLPMGT